MADPLFLERLRDSFATVMQQTIVFSIDPQRSAQCVDDTRTVAP